MQIESALRLWFFGWQTLEIKERKKSRDLESRTTISSHRPAAQRGVGAITSINAVTVIPASQKRVNPRWLLFYACVNSYALNHRSPCPRLTLILWSCSHGPASAFSWRQKKKYLRSLREFFHSLVHCRIKAKLYYQTVECSGGSVYL